MTCWSKCRPLNRSVSDGFIPRHYASAAESDEFAPEPLSLPRRRDFEHLFVQLRSGRCCWRAAVKFESINISDLYGYKTIHALHNRFFRGSPTRTQRHYQAGLCGLRSGICARLRCLGVPSVTGWAMWWPRSVISSTIDRFSDANLPRGLAQLRGAAETISRETQE